MKTKRLLLLATLFFSVLTGTAQTQFWSDNFEDAGAPSSGSRTLSLAEFGCNSPSTAYFKRTDGTDIIPTSSYSSFQGAKFWSAMDIDRGSTCVNNTISAGQSITWSGINIAGKSGLSFKGLFGQNNGAIFQGVFFANAANSFTMDSMAIEYRIDGGAWTKIIGIYPNNGTASGGTMAVDNTGDRIGDSPTLGLALTEVSANITGTGSTLDLRFDIFVNNGNPGSLAVDNFRLFETPSCTAPTITANPPNRSICVNGNTTFTASATGATAYQWQVNTGSGFTDITNGGVYSNATTTTLNITGATAGMNGYQYRCTAINAVASCFTNTTSGTLNISNITSSTAKNDVLCFGNATGSAAVSPTGGIGSYTYSWSPSGGTSSIATGLAAGSYTCTITDAISCQITKNFTITQPASALNAAVGGGKTNVSCNGGSNGTATVAPTGGTPGYTYSWSPSGGTAATATGLAVGSYTVTVTDANNCQATRSYTITQPTALNTASGSKTDVSCNGGSNGTATVSPTGGTPGYTYSWAPSGGTSATATGLAAGTYTVTVTDANGCTGTKSFTITQPTALNTTAGSKTDVSCNGGSNGTATVSPTGGTPSYTYSWAPSGGTSATATGLAAGTYTVTVTDANACQATKSFTITQPTALNSTISKTDVSCNGGSNGTATVSPTGGTPSYTYSWAPSGGTAATATGLAAGTYTCTITDANACQITKSITVGQPASALSTATGGGKTDVSCNGGSNGTATVAPTGGTPSYSYSWAPAGGTSATATGLAAGTYTVTVTDFNGCQATRSYTITQPTALNTTAGSKTDVSCNGGSNGTATVSPTGGTPSYTYSWAPSGGTAATATGLAAGTYTVTVTDANSCTGTKSFTITQPTALNTSAGSKTDVSCNGGSNGTATVSPTGGTPSYTYSWAPSGGTAATATGLAAGTYTVTVTDANGCTGTKSFTITQPTALSSTISKTDVSCNSGSNGTATVSPTGGTPSYTYSWSPSGGTAATATGLAAGTYTCTITDANSCQTTQTATITEPTAISVTPSHTDVSCNNGNNGTASVSVSGGVPSYTYSWSPSGGTAATATGLFAGTYTVTVTDANNCQASQSVTITEPAAITFTGFAQTDVSCFGGSNGTYTVNPATGGAGSFTYDWSPGTPTGDGTTSVSGLSAGSYSVVATDANGCTATISFVITEPTALVATAASQTDVSCNGGANGSATVSVTGGTPGYTYVWSPSVGTTPTVNGLTAGTYDVTVTDANNCQATQSFIITEPTALLTSISSQTDVSCNGGSNGSATVDVTGGTPSYTYSWSPAGGTGSSATGLTAGTYTVTVTDANGCSATQSVTINEPTALVVSISSQTDVNCNGGTDGSVTVNVTGGTPSYTYSWSPAGGTAATATDLAAGTYTVTVTDANGCSATQIVTITEPTALVATLQSQTDVLCNGNSTGSATVDVTGGTPMYTYSWAPSGGSSPIATDLAAGTYTVTVTDANGCSTTLTVTITEPAALVATAQSQTDISCNGGNDGSATVDVTGGVTNYTYSWAPSGGSSDTATGLTAGTYTVTVTDDNGCTTSQSFTLTEPGAITSTTTIAACDSYMWTDGTTYTASGTYVQNLTSASGCDSTATLVLTINTTPTAGISQPSDLILQASGTGSYQWINCANNTPVSGATAATFVVSQNGSYAVVVSNGSCSDTSNCITINNVGLNELSSFGVTIVPNPAKDQFKINMDGISSATVMLYDAQGKLVKSIAEVTSGQAITLDGVERGVYMVNIQSEKGWSTQRLVVQ